MKNVTLLITTLIISQFVLIKDKLGILLSALIIKMVIAMLNALRMTRILLFTLLMESVKILANILIILQNIFAKLLVIML